MTISISGDILVSSVRDHYTTLHYKTLAGFVWVNRYCGGARFIVKIDDDVRLDVDNLRRTLSRKFGDSGTVPDIIECSAAVMRNVRPFQRSARSVTNERPSLLTNERTVFKSRDQY